MENLLPVEDLGDGYSRAEFQDRAAKRLLWIQEEERKATECRRAGATKGRIGGRPKATAASVQSSPA